MTRVILESRPGVSSATGKVVANTTSHVASARTAPERHQHGGFAGSGSGENPLTKHLPANQSLTNGAFARRCFIRGRGRDVGCPTRALYGVRTSEIRVHGYRSQTWHNMSDRRNFYRS